MYNGNRIEWSPIRSVIIRVITKSNDCAAGVQFVYYEYDYRPNCWFSHDVTKFQTSELLILFRFYFHDVLEQLKTNIHTNFHSKWVLGLVIDYA